MVTFWRVGGPCSGGAAGVIREVYAEVWVAVSVALRFAEGFAGNRRWNQILQSALEELNRSLHTLRV